MKEDSNSGISDFKICILTYHRIHPPPEEHCNHNKEETMPRCFITYCSLETDEELNDPTNRYSRML
jgi:hypothetical protein